MSPPYRLPRQHFLDLQNAVDYGNSEIFHVGLFDTSLFHVRKESSTKKNIYIGLFDASLFNICKEFSTLRTLRYEVCQKHVLTFRKILYKCKCGCLYVDASLLTPLCKCLISVSSLCVDVSYVYIYVCVLCVYVCMHIYIYIYIMYMYIYTYMLMYIYIYGDACM